MHITHEWSDDSPRHGFSLAEHIGAGCGGAGIHATISERGAVVGARFHPGGFAARFNRDAAAMTGRMQPVDDQLFGGPIHLEDDVDALVDGSAMTTGDTGSSR
jgi:hypothetical protein